MKKLYNNEPINIHNLEQGNTGNANLDYALSNAKNEPLIFSIGEVNTIIDNAIIHDSTSSVIRNTLIVGGTVLVSAIFGWMYYEFNAKSNNNQTAINTNTTKNESTSEKNKIKLSIDNASTNYEIKTENSVSPSLTSNEDLKSTSNKSDAISNNAIIVNNNSDKTENKKQSSRNIITSPDKKESNNKSEILNSNSASSRQISESKNDKDITAEELKSNPAKRQSARITINSKGIESVYINGKALDPSLFYLFDNKSYSEAITESVESKEAELNSNATHKLSEALIKNDLIKEGEKFKFKLTVNSAILNNYYLSKEIHNDLLAIYHSVFGTNLPNGSEFLINNH